jgi:hypothetical protein
VLLLAGKPGEAAAALEQALARYERKGNLVSTQRARTRLAELQDAAGAMSVRTVQCAVAKLAVTIERDLAPTT